MKLVSTEAPKWTLVESAEQTRSVLMEQRLVQHVVVDMKQTTDTQSVVRTMSIYRSYVLPIFVSQDFILTHKDLSISSFLRNYFLSSHLGYYN